VQDRLLQLLLLLLLCHPMPVLMAMTMVLAWLAYCNG
jgi:hypothetical protein